MLEGFTFTPAIPPRVAQFMRMIDAFERNEIEAAVEALIARLDDRDGDPDREDDDSDCCGAGDDRIDAGPVHPNARTFWERHDRYTGALVGDDADAEASDPPGYLVDQSAALFLTAANDHPGFGA